MATEVSSERFPISVIILTRDEERNIGDCVTSLDWADDIIVVDSHSSDRTIEVAQGVREDIRVFSHSFRDFADQRNWALQNTGPRHRWILFFDADERCTHHCAQAIQRAVAAPADNVGYYLCYRNFFLNRWIKHCTCFPSWQLRVLRAGRAQFQRAGHGQQEVADGSLGYVREPYDHHGFSKGIGHWIARHNAYSSAEIEMIENLRKEPLRLTELFHIDPVRRRRCMKRIAVRIPFRPIALFLYIYLLRGGFLDGRAGLIFCLLQLSHELQLYAKLEEHRLQSDHDSKCGFRPG